MPIVYWIMVVIASAAGAYKVGNDVGELKCNTKKHKSKSENDDE